MLHKTEMETDGKIHEVITSFKNLNMFQKPINATQKQE